MKQEKSVFEVLSSINMNDKIEKKNGMSYISWSNAWGELLKHYPTAIDTVYCDHNGNNYFTDGKTCWVRVGVTIEGIERIEELPVMNSRNQSLPYDVVTSTDINKSQKRCLVKALAKHGLALYVYAGEDFPEDIDNAVSKVTKSDIVSQLKKDGFQDEKPEVGMDIAVRTKWLKDMASKAVSVDDVMSKMKSKYKLSATLEKSLKDEYIGYLATAKG
jgi:hypothetical protein